MKAEIFENAMVKIASLSSKNPKIIAAFVKILVSLFLVQLEAVKISKFDDSAGKMTVRNDDGARKRDKEAICTFRRINQKTNCSSHFNKINRRYDNCLKKDERCLDNIAVSTLEKDNLYYAKRKANTAQSDPHEHSFETLSLMRTKLLEKNPSFIYHLNDCNINGKPSFVFKISRT